MNAMRLNDGAALVFIGGGIAITLLVKDHLSTPFDSLFDKVGKQYEVSPNLLRAIGKHESNFNPAAIGVNKDSNGKALSNDLGLMQINEGTALRMGLDTHRLLTDVEYNIAAAAKVLNDIKKSLGSKLSDYTLVWAYNTGPDLEPASKGQVYAAAVMWHWQLFEIGRLFA